MAIFKKTTKEVKAKKGESTLGNASRRASKDIARHDFAKSAIVRPHITEKAAILAEKGTYVFEVAKDTNKIEIAKAIGALYNVTPVRVNIVNLPKTNVFVRGKAGVKAGVRKALVTLKKGDKIEIL